jgi:hypothetical protein
MGTSQQLNLARKSRTTIRFTDEEKVVILAVADEEGVTTSEAIRRFDLLGKTPGVLKKTIRHDQALARMNRYSDRIESCPTSA